MEPLHLDGKGAMFLISEQNGAHLDQVIYFKCYGTTVKLLFGIRTLYKPHSTKIIILFLRDEMRVLINFCSVSGLSFIA